MIATLWAAGTLAAQSGPPPPVPAPVDAAGEEGHRREQAELVTLSRFGRQVVAERSGHHIPLEQPELVVSAIRDVLATRPRP